MWWTPPAHAHDTSTEAGLRPFVRDGALVAAWTTTGLWVNDRGWQRVCHESLDRVNDVWLAPDGSFVLATFDGLVRATDGGCTRTPDPSRLAPLVALVPLGDRLAAVEVHADGDRLLVSTDGGASFADVAPLPEPIDVGSVGADGDGGWWVGAGYLDPRLFWS
ncbi:MAG: hypothetical protein ABMA64_28725, partial [Myxococcota bacterium]